MELSNYSKIFKALSNEQRLKIFRIIYDGCCDSKEGSVFPIKSGSQCPMSGSMEKAFSKVCGCMKLSRSTISHHFKELQAAGLITCEREGQNIRCRVNPEAIKEIKEFLG